MSAVRQSLQDFTRAYQHRYSQDSARCNDDGAFVVLKSATVHIHADEQAERVVFWTDLDMPTGCPIATIERVAMDYTTKRFIAAGFVMGVSRAAGLIALGRSVDAAVLRDDQAFQLVQDLAREAPIALAHIDNAGAAALANARRGIDPGAVGGRA